MIPHHEKSTDMNKKRFSFSIASDTSKEKVLFVEVFYEDDQLAEISQEGPEPMLVLLRPSSAKYWESSLKEALEAFQEAEKSLLEE